MYHKEQRKKSDIFYFYLTIKKEQKTRLKEHRPVGKSYKMQLCTLGSEIKNYKRACSSLVYKISDRLKLP